MKTHLRERIVGFAESRDQEISPEGDLIFPPWAKIVGVFNRDSVDIPRRQIRNQLHRTGRCAKNETRGSRLGNSDRPSLDENFSKHGRCILGGNTGQSLSVATRRPVLPYDSVPPVESTEMAIEQNDRNSRRPFARARIELHPKIAVVPGEFEAFVAGLGEPCQ